MMRHPIVRVTLLLTACLLLPFAAQASQATSDRIPTTSRHRAALGRAFEAQRETENPTAKIAAPLRERSGQVGVVIELSAEPTVQTFARAQAAGAAPQATLAAQAQMARINQAQMALLAPLAQAGAQVLYRTQRVYNGIAARVDASKLAQIARLPGVKAIHPLVKHRIDNATSVPLIGAPELWAGAGLPSPLTGSGIKIAIIDTGIDYIHTAFGGSGAKADYTRNNTTVITESGLFPSAKVVGGYDFVGDDYDGSNTPQPDPDPLDCNGHGSHVAGTAAGLGVKGDGSTYTGPYNQSITETLRIGPGVAPQASLYALRVFGCDGSTEVVNEAIEWAVDPNGDGNFSDRVDVINMSLGSDFGYEQDATSVAADNAVLAGVIVVASAGNDNDTYFITGSPGSASKVISVASSADSTDILDGIRENSPTARDLPASNSVAYPWVGSSDPVTGTLVMGTLVYPQDQPSGCTAFSASNKALIAGKIVLLDWADGQCGSVTRGANLVAAGAIGGILADNSEVFDLFITGSNRIPMVSTPKSVGDMLKADLAGAVSVTLSSEYISSVPYVDARVSDTLSSFSSRGPRRYDTALKPDIAAPGQGIFSAGALTGDKGANISGTSMAAPHVAGSMALLRQLHPTWTIQELKALAMNTALNNVRSGLEAGALPYPPSRVGGGRIDLPEAAGASVIAYSDDRPELVSVSFGSVEVLGTTTLTRTITIKNKGSSPATYNLAYTPSNTIPGVSYALSASSVTLDAGATASVIVTMTANPSSMKHTHDPTISEAQGGRARPWLSEASGYVALTRSGLAMSYYSAWGRGAFENPPVASQVAATAALTYTASTKLLEYRVDFSKPITLTAAHFHSAAAGLNGGVAHPITTGDNTFGPGDSLTGNVTLTDASEALLLKGELYFNFHTAAYPGGEVRGQVVPALGDTALRVPVYANARPVSDMQATVSTLDVTAAPDLAATLVLTGTGVNTGSSTPTDITSLVSAFELQYRSPNETNGGTINDKADLAYVGVASDVAATNFFTETMLYFGIATHGDWSSPNEVEFDIYIDTDRDGQDDIVLFNSNLGFQSGQDQNDVLLTFVYNFATDDFFFADYINGVPPSNLDTAVFNNNVIVLPVAAADLGLTSDSSRFNYRIETFSLDATSSEPGFGGAISGQIDQSEILTYDAAKPGVDASGGYTGVPAYNDLPSAEIDLKLSPVDFVHNRSKGVLLLHHHNRSGQRAQVITTPASRAFLPITRR